MQEGEESVAVNPLATQMFYVFTSRAEIIRIVALGVISGLLIPLLTWLIADYFINPVFCASGDNVMDICVSGRTLAGHGAAVLVGLVSFVLLMRWKIFRALLIVVASTIAMWGLAKYASPILGNAWLEYYAYSAALYTGAYFVFYWLLRIRSFPLSFAAVLLTVIGACVILVV